MATNRKNTVDTIMAAIVIIGIVGGFLYMSNNTGGGFMPQVDMSDSLLADQAPAPIVDAANVIVEVSAPPVEHEYTEPAAVNDESSSLFSNRLFLYSGVGLIVAVLAMGGLMAMASRNSTKTDQPEQPQPQQTIKRPAAKRTGDVPAGLLAVVDGVLLSRGGQSEGQPSYWIESDRCHTNPLSWTFGFDYATGKSPDELHKYENDLVSRLCRAGCDTTVRIDVKRSLIEIFNPEPQTFALRDHWQQIKTMPANKRFCTPGVEVIDGIAKPKRLQLKDEGSAYLVAGMPRAGKTQLAMSMILTLCAANSPERLSLIVADTKAIDTAALAGLPHLVALESDPLKIASITDAMVTEMRERQRAAKTGDTSFLKRVICFYVDEAADLYIGAGDRGDDIAKNIQQLVQTGLGLGFIIILASQRMGFLPTEMYSLLPRRCVLRVGSGNDSFQATGAKGTQCHKLPRRQFEIFTAGSPEGERGQGFFVADPSDDDYKASVEWFISDIKATWPGARPCWSPSNIMPPTVADEPVSMATIDASVDADDGADDDAGIAQTEAILDEFDPQFIQMLENAYDSNPNRWNKQRVRETYAMFMDKPNARLKGRREAAVWAAIKAKMEDKATKIAEDL
jgi:hypothetical protein